MGSLLTVYTLMPPTPLWHRLLGPLGSSDESALFLWLLQFPFHLLDMVVCQQLRIVQ